MHGKTKKVVILTEGGEQQGFGRVSRCLALSRAFERAGWLTEFYVHGDQTMANLFVRQCFTVVDWCQVLENENLQLFQKDVDVIIVDSGLAHISVYEKIAEKAKVVVYLDDNVRLGYPRGIVVNWSINAPGLAYPRKKGLHYLLGSEYVALREPFWAVPEPTVPRQLQSVLVSFGGNDSKNMTPAVLGFLVAHYPTLYKRVVIGNAFSNITDIQSEKDHLTQIIFSPDGEGMKQVMLQSDIAIVSGGQTLYELARVGVPAVVVAVLEEQRNHVSGWEKNGFIENAGFWAESPLMAHLDQKFQVMATYERRVQAVAAGCHHVDGQGAFRIVDYCQKMAFPQ